MHAGEEDHVGIDRLRLHGERQRIAEEVGRSLHVGRSIVVGQDHGAAFAFELGDAFGQIGGVVSHLFYFYSFNEFILSNNNKKKPCR